MSIQRLLVLEMMSIPTFLQPQALNFLNSKPDTLNAKTFKSYTLYLKDPYPKPQTLNPLQP